MQADGPPDGPRALRWIAGDGPLILGWCADLIAIGIAWSRYGQLMTEPFWLLVVFAIVAGVASLDNARARTDGSRHLATWLSIACVLTALGTAAAVLRPVTDSAGPLAR